MRMSIEDRGGFALPAALLALVVVGALVTGGLYASMSEDRSSSSVEFGSHAFMAAEQGMQDLLGTKTRMYFQDTVAIATTDTLGPIAVDVNGVDAQYTLFVQRLNSRLFKVESEGEVLETGRYTGSRRRIAEMMRIHYTLVPKDRAYTTQAPVRLRGQSAINGTDLVPTGWDDCETVGTQAALVTDDSTTVDVPPGGGGNAGLVGNPKSREDPTLDSLKFTVFGDMQLDELKSYANITLAPATYNGMAPSVSGTECNRTDPNNWGDPVNTSGACHFYWPIIHSTGDLKLTTGVGQGILIVDGNLEVSGNVEFYGIIFVYGNIRATGTGNKFSGSVNVLGTNEYSELGVTGAGNTQVQLSACAIERAHLYNTRLARPIPLGARKFIDVSGLGVN